MSNGLASKHHLEASPSPHAVPMPCAEGSWPGGAGAGEQPSAPGTCPSLWQCCSWLGDLAGVVAGGEELGCGAPGEAAHTAPSAGSRKCGRNLYLLVFIVAGSIGDQRCCAVLPPRPAGAG